MSEWEVTRRATAARGGQLEHEAPAAPPRSGGWSATLLRVARRYPLGTASAATLLVVVLLAAAAPIISPHDPVEFLAVGPFTTPSADAWLGTDQIGRDLFARILYGARTSLTIATVATAAGVSTGAVLGLVSGYFGGKTDMVMQRLMDVFDALPALVLAILLVALLGSSPVNVTIAIAVILVPGVNRIARAVTLGTRESTYVEAAVVLGASPRRILAWHLAPALGGPLIVVAATAVGSSIVAESSLSFLGLGPPPPAPTWGQMLSGEVRQYFVTHPWLAVAPGLALTITVLAISLLGDALRDALDPRTTRR